MVPNKLRKLFESNGRIADHFVQADKMVQKFGIAPFFLTTRNRLQKRLAVFAYFLRADAEDLGKLESGGGAFFAHVDERLIGENDVGRDVIFVGEFSIRF